MDLWILAFLIVQCFLEILLVLDYHYHPLGQSYLLGQSDLLDLSDLLVLDYLGNLKCQDFLEILLVLQDLRVLDLLEVLLDLWILAFPSVQCLLEALDFRYLR